MEVFKKEDMQFRLNNDGTAVVVGYTGTSSSVVIPEKIERYPVVGIEAAAFENCHKVKRIQIPASVTCIERNAFKNCGRNETVDKSLSLAYTATSRRDLEYMFGYGAESYESRIRSEENPVTITHDFTAIVVGGSYAESYCKEHNIAYIAK